MTSNKTAIDLVTKNILVIRSDNTVGDVERKLLDNKYEFIDYIYVVNYKENLTGVISIKELFREDKGSVLKRIMHGKVFSVKPEDDQEKAAKLALNKNIKAVPVVKGGNILGVIPYHSILSVLHEEGIEDLLYSAGIHDFEDPARDIIHASTFTHFKKRLPWLLLGLLGGTIAAMIVGVFEEMLDVYIILAAFIPAVVYMADAIGNQAQILFIRSMALEDVSYWNYILREMKVNLFLGLVISFVFYLVVLLGWSDAFFALVIGISILATTFISVLIAVILPILFKKFDFDPAVSTGPFSTAVIDLSSLLVYFGIASLMIAFL